MSFLSELMHGRFTPKDLTSHFKEDLPYWLGAAGLATGGLGLAGMGPLSGLGGAAAGAEAGALGLGAAEGAGLGAEALTATEFLPGLTEATTASEFFPGLEGLSGLEGVATAESAAGVGEAATEFSSAAQSAADPITSLSGPLTPDKAASGSNPMSALFGSDTAATGANQSGGFMSDVLGGAKKSITSNPLGTGAAALGLGMTMFGGDKNSADLQKIKEQAAQLGEQGAFLQQYLKDGTLPPAMKAQMDQATNAAKARIRSNHAKSGMGADPSTNSALAQELNSVDINAVAAMAQSQIDMMKVGLTETGLSNQMYQYLVKLDREDNKELMNSIAKFASALGGGSKGKGNTFSISAN